MNYTELSAAIQSYTENQFPETYLADSSTVSSTTQINQLITQAEQRIYNSVQFPFLRKNVTSAVTASNKYLSCPNDFLAVYSLAIILSTGSYVYLLNKDVNMIRQAYPNPTSTGTPQYYALFGPTTTNAIPPVITNELSFILGPTPDAVYSVELHYFYYPESIVQAVILSLGTLTGGSSYVNGLYYNVPLTGGSGTGAYADITVSGNAVVTVVIRNGGCLYKVGDALSATAANIGGAGTGFSIPVVTVTNVTGTSWLGENFDSVLLYGSLVEAMTYMKSEPDLVALYNTKYNEALSLAKRLGDGLERGDAYRNGQARVAVT